MSRAPQTQSTIAAIATGAASGGIGIIRLSGPLALAQARLVAPSLPAAPEPRRAYFTTLCDDAGQPLDEALVLSFTAPHSFTGEDVVELQMHGSLQLLRLVLARLLADGTVRHAEPGEFTRRAFTNGRIDLARAEAVADLIAAESDAAVRASAAQLTGAFSRRIDALRDALVELAADLEGMLDFPDESDEAAERDDVAQRVASLLATLQTLLDDATVGAATRKTSQVVLYGPVNAGKSTLFNALVGADKALVDAEAGTTRDLLEATIELGGFRIALTDTAGLRDDPGRIEALGISRARTALQAADLAVLIAPPDASPHELTGWQAEVEEGRRLDVCGKGDMAQCSTWNTSLTVSGLTGAGVPELKQALLVRLGLRTATASMSASVRHLEALTRALESLRTAEQALSTNALELVAAEVALTLHTLGEITGHDATAETIDAIFKRFCIGK